MSGRPAAGATRAAGAARADGAAQADGAARAAGRVSLVGAGPGETGLLTCKGAERLGQADVVLFDRFVGEGILGLIPASAERIDVGKHAGHHPVPQPQINQLLLDKARQGLKVVRLKGGDPFVFGRGGEELELLAEHGIDFEVVPGVTSAIAGPAYAGIPVTHRDFASSVHFITSQGKDNEPPKIDYEALARLGGTLVFLMGVAAIESICEGCLAAGMDADTPAAIVENATTGRQRKLVASLSTLAGQARAMDVVSPALVIVGQVCQLSERYDWFSTKPLLGKRVAVPRVKPGPSRLAAALRELGAEAVELQAAALRLLPEAAEALSLALQGISRFSWLVFTSGFGVEAFFGQLAELGFDIRGLAHLKIACVGPETARALSGRGLLADYQPDQYNGAALARGLAELAASGERLLLARAKGGSPELPRILSDAGLDFEELLLYERAQPQGGGSAAEAAASLPSLDGFDCAAFTSSSAVEGFVAMLPGLDFAQVKAFCIGPATAATARQHGMQIVLSAESTIASLAEAVAEAAKQQETEEVQA